MGLLDEVQLPFYWALKTGGPSDKDAWNLVLVINIKFFKDIRTVRTDTALLNSSSMIMGAFWAMEPVREYVRHRCLQLPKISSVLALTSMERGQSTGPQPFWQSTWKVCTLRSLKAGQLSWRRYLNC